LIHLRNDTQHRISAAFQGLHDRLFAPTPMQQISFDRALGVFKATAMSRQKHAVITV